MVEPRFIKYTRETADKKQTAKKKSRQNIKWALVSFLVFATLAIVLWSLAWRAPVNNSLVGAYSPPGSRTAIKPYSKARWLLHEAHAAQLKTCLAWYHYVKLSPADSCAALDKAGFRPFLFVDEKDSVVNIFDQTSDESALNKCDFAFSLTKVEGALGGFLRRRSLENSSILKNKWITSKDDNILVDPKILTSVYAQFLPSKPKFSEQYACYLANVWDMAVASYVAIYHKPPTSLEGLLDGLGLKPNPDCIFPIDSKSPGISCEGGLINGQIVYWKVNLSGGVTKGQARYYDTYDTSWDDPGTPQKITTQAGTSPVADPALVQGQREVMFNNEIIRKFLDSGKNAQGQG